MIWLGLFVGVMGYIVFALGYSCGWHAAVRDLLTPDKKP